MFSVVLGEIAGQPRMSWLRTPNSQSSTQNLGILYVVRTDF